MRLKSKTKVRHLIFDEICLETDKDNVIIYARNGGGKSTFSAQYYPWRVKNHSDIHDRKQSNLNDNFKKTMGAVSISWHLLESLITTSDNNEEIIIQKDKGKIDKLKMEKKVMEEITTAQKYKKCKFNDIEWEEYKLYHKLGFGNIPRKGSLLQIIGKYSDYEGNQLKNKISKWKEKFNIEKQNDSMKKMIDDPNSWKVIEKLKKLKTWINLDTFKTKITPFSHFNSRQLWLIFSEYENNESIANIQKNIVKWSLQLCLVCCGNIRDYETSYINSNNFKEFILEYKKYHEQESSENIIREMTKILPWFERLGQKIINNKLIDIKDIEYINYIPTENEVKNHFKEKIFNSQLFKQYFSKNNELNVLIKENKKIVNQEISSLFATLFEKHYLSNTDEKAEVKYKENVQQITAKIDNLDFDYLSEGEKKIIALIFLIAYVKVKSKNEIIIFDDPIDSNDMISASYFYGVVEKFLDDRKIIYLTHSYDLIKLLNPDNKEDIPIFLMKKKNNQIKLEKFKTSRFYSSFSYYLNNSKVDSFEILLMYMLYQRYTIKEMKIFTPIEEIEHSAKNIKETLGSCFKEISNLKKANSKNNLVDKKNIEKIMKYMTSRDIKIPDYLSNSELLWHLHFFTTLQKEKINKIFGYNSHILFEWITLSWCISTLTRDKYHWDKYIQLICHVKENKLMMLIINNDDILERINKEFSNEIDDWRKRIKILALNYDD